METSSSSEEAEWTVKLPEKYKIQKVLGEGGFGKVLQCWRTDTEETVAVKIPLNIDIDNKKEIAILKKLMCFDFDRCNIVKFFGWFHTSCGKALVFELLDICILDFIMNIDLGPFLLSDIRVIILQMAIALEALKTVGLIHADIKMDNIMMMDHRTRPFRVKLIDFGLTMYRSRAKPGMHVQTINYRAPEIFLGMSFSEAIDVWSLGCVMAAMLFSYPLFCKFDEFREIRQIMEVLGQPADHLLDGGKKTRRFFIMTDSNNWRIKTDKEYFGWFYSGQERRIQDETLDAKKEMHLKSMDKSEVEDGKRCFDLLKAMLKFNEAERIRPNQILTHPFITIGQNCAQRRGPDSTQRDVVTNIHPERPPGTTSVEPAPPERTQQLKEERGLSKWWRIRVHWCEKIKKKRSRKTDAGVSTFSTQLPSSEIIAPPAASGSRMDRLQGVGCLQLRTAVKEKVDTIKICQKLGGPSPIIPTGMILVKPAAPENTLQMEDKKKRVDSWELIDISEEDVAKVTPERRGPSPAVPAGSILVGNAPHLEDESIDNWQIGLRSKKGIYLKHWSSEDSSTDSNIDRKKKMKKSSRFLTWMRRALFSCIMDDEEDF